MSNPLVSVVIPSYNQAEYVGEAIQSVINQTYQNFEIIIVNDASPDDTTRIVNEFNDPRILLVTHEENRGLPAARNTGITASSGEFIALLDSDDMFHPEKLESHVDFLEENSEIGASYNNRFELDFSAETIGGIWRPPRNVTLVDFVCGFPFSPSDMVLRRGWTFEVNFFREEFTHGGEDLDFFCRLAVSGCKFARVDRALNYRRRHAGRQVKRLSSRLDEYISALDTIFEDPRCPENVSMIKSEAYARHHLEVAFYALLQGEVDLGQETIRTAVQLDPSLITGCPSEVVIYFLHSIIKDENRDHEKLLRQMISRLPFQIAKLMEQTNWAVGRGYILRGTRAIIWDRIEVGQDHFARAKSLGAQIDENFIQQLVVQLLNYEAEFGPEATEEVLKRLSPFLNWVGKSASARWLKGRYSANKGLNSFGAGEYAKVPGDVFQAVISDPGYIFNRGMLSILSRSLIHSVFSKYA